MTLVVRESSELCLATEQDREIIRQLVSTVQCDFCILEAMISASGFPPEGTWLWIRETKRAFFKIS
jgi:hypothetical protein